MPDQYGVVTKLLEKMGLAQWHVVEPVPGGLRGNVWIQNSEKGLDAYVELSPAGTAFLSEDEMIARIQVAIPNATDTRYRS